MNRVALLASGPSLPRFWNADKSWDYDSVIAVNSAAWEFPCDWMAAADYFSLWPVMWGDRRCMRPRVGFVSELEKGPGIRETGLEFRALPGFGEELGLRWTFPCALRFALELCPDVDVYGFDCARDLPDCAGHMSDHSTARFEAELYWVKRSWSSGVRVFSDLPEKILSWLQGSGILVTID